MSWWTELRDWLGRRKRPEPPTGPNPPQPPPPGPPVKPPITTGKVQECLGLLNQERLAQKRAKVSLEPRLTAAAQKWSGVMNQRRDAQHEFPGHPNFIQRMEAEGYRWADAGEIAVESLTPAGAVWMWMGSRGHKEQILKRNYIHCGIGETNGFWCVLFAEPRTW